MESKLLANYKKMVRKFIEIPKEQERQLDKFLESAEKITYKRNAYFSTIEEPSASIAFVAKGLFRLYIIDREGNEATLNFRGENTSMSSYGAVLLDKIEPVYIQAIEDSEIYAISRTKILEFHKTDTVWQNLFQKMTETDCLRLRRREFSFLQDDAKTRYLEFLNDFAPYADRIKLRYVASYLGITPEALSRIRSAPL